MRNDKRLKKIADIIATTLGRNFDHAKILNVTVHSDVDSDGDEVLRIEVIFEGQPKNVDARKLSGAVRQVRPKLEAIGETAFPLFSFISQGDIGTARFEPA